MQCGDIQEALLRGETPANADARAHLDGCPACAALVKGAGPLRAALRDADPLGVDVEALFVGIKSRIDDENKAMPGYLRSRPTWMRVVIGCAAVALIMMPVVFLKGRPDLADYPRERMIGVLMSMSVALLVTFAIALRPAYRPPISRAAIAAIALAGLVLSFLVCVMPMPGVEHPPLSAEELMPQAMPCIYYGILFGAPIYVLIRALDHEVTRLAALLAASSAGLTANLGLHLHCSNSHPGHMLLGHFSVALMFLVLVAVATMFFDKYRARATSRAR